MPKQSKRSKPKRQSAPQRLDKVLWLLRYGPVLLAVILLLAATSLNLRWWPLEFVVSYMPQLLILSWVLLMIYAVMLTWYMFIHGAKQFYKGVGKARLGLLLLAGMIGVYSLAHSINVVSALDIEDTLSHQSGRLTVGTFNKLYRSENFARDASLITAAKVDVFSLQEVERREIDYLKTSLNHPYSYITECRCSADNTEVGLISRYPIINARTIYEHPNSVIARALISSEEYGDFVVYIVHMHVPYDRGSYELRDDAYNLLSRSINQESLPTFAVGDFNTTVYSPDMQDFTANSPGIQNVVARAWPKCTWFGTVLHEFACARIDYVFAPQDASVKSLEIGRQDYSDHRSVIVEVEI